MTQLGFLLLPLCLLWSLRPDRLLQLVVGSSVFGAAAALIFGGFGVQPTFVPAALFVGYVALQLLLGARYPGGAHALRVVTPFLLVVAWALIGSVVLPRVFAGQVFVWPQKPEPPFTAVPLIPTSSNYTQDAYIFADAALLVTGAMFMTRTGLRLQRFLDAYLWAGLVVVGICVWQFANKIAHVWFPSDFLFSNPGWVIFADQRFGPVPRLNGPFAEPAALATYLAGIVSASGWLILKGHPGRLPRVVFPTALVAMLMSTSTTAFAMLGIIVLGLPAYAMLRGSRRMLTRVMGAAMALVAVSIFMAMAIATFSPGSVAGASRVYDETMNKQDSESFANRTLVDADSMATVLPTFGLGVGWGSNRSSSLVPGLLANIGVVGVLGLVWFGFGVTRQVRRSYGLARDPGRRMVMDGCTAAIAGTVVASCLSGPTIDAPVFYFLLALLVACAVRVECDVRRPSRARPMAMSVSHAVP